MWHVISGWHSSSAMNTPALSGTVIKTRVLAAFRNSTSYPVLFQLLHENGDY